MAHIVSALFLVNICIILISTCQASKLPKFSSILIFGDSLLDTGNNNFIPTMVRADHPPYGRSFPGGIPTGRFSDGKLMSDLLAEALEIKETVPPFLQPNLSDDDIRTGVCFASAGSGYDDATTVATGVIPVSKQYGTYFREYVKRLDGVVGEKEARNILNSSFVFVTSGSNDMAISFYSGSPWGLQFTLDGYQNYLLERVKKFIQVIFLLFFSFYF